MNLDKAIEILQLNIKSVSTSMPTDTLTAVKLSVEALKEVQKHRTWPLHLDIGFLPGETEASDSP